VGLSTIELYCNFEGLPAPSGGSTPTDILLQSLRSDLVILDWSVHGQHRIDLVELTCPWNTDAKKAEKCKASKYAELLLCAMRGGTVVCILSRLEGMSIFLIRDMWEAPLRFTRFKILTGGHPPSLSHTFLTS
jgi:hypothetical protein